MSVKRKDTEVYDHDPSSAEIKRRRDTAEEVDDDIEGDSVSNDQFDWGEDFSLLDNPHPDMQETPQNSGGMKKGDRVRAQFTKGEPYTTKNERPGHVWECNSCHAKIKQIDGFTV